MEAADEFEEEAWCDPPDWRWIFVGVPWTSRNMRRSLTAHSASVTSIVRLKYVLKYSNSFDSTWDNVDVIKWSLIEILAACFCGNLLALRPLIEQIIPPFRSIYSRHSNRRSSRKTTHKTFLGLRSFGRFGRSGDSGKPIIPTLHLTQMSLSPSPTPTPGWDWKDSSNSDQVTIVSPRTPTPAHLEKTIEFVEQDYVQDVPHGSVRKIPTPFRSRHTESDMTASQKTMTDSIDRPSGDGSVRGLVPPARERPQRISGPWSRAFAVLYD